jgi:MarR family transcriptional regulator, organic hydroperoxide resistance regulator
MRLNNGIGGVSMKISDEETITRLQMLFQSIFKKIGADVAEQLSKTGLTKPQFMIMQFIGQREHCRVTDIANIMEVKPSAITLMIDRLVSAGWVNRREDPSDRRAVVIELTDEGKDILAEAKQKCDRLTADYLACFSREELDLLIRLYEKLEQSVYGRERKDVNDDGT